MMRRAEKPRRDDNTHSLFQKTNCCLFVSRVGQDVPVSRCRHGGEGKVYAGQVQGERLFAVRTISRHSVPGAIVVGDPVALGRRVQPRRIPTAVVCFDKTWRER